MIARRRAIVVAFDGLVADTLTLRARAVVGALASHGTSCTVEDAVEMIAGRTFVECIRELLGRRPALVDETVVDLATLQANAEYAQSTQGAVSLCRDVTSWLQQAATRVHVVVRSDSDRSLVERILAAAGLEMLVNATFCANDGYSTRASSSFASIRELTFTRSWRAIQIRVATLGIAHEDLIGLECASELLCSSVDSSTVRRVTSVTEFHPVLPRLS